MSKHALENVELTNMCMICDDSTGKVLVQIRDKNDWDGISFPGGHVEFGESLVSAVIREVEEETGLSISHVIPCGFKDWYDFKKKKRYLVFFFKTNTFTGTLKESSSEGKNLWMSVEDIYLSQTASDFHEMLDIFLGNTVNCEFFYEDNQNEEEQKRWTKKFY